MAGPMTNILTPCVGRTWDVQQQRIHPFINMYACLYTKHKTQKRKVWQDGRLVVRGAVAHLHRADPILGGGDPRLDACEVLPNLALAPGQLLEMESHLVTVEGAWTGAVTLSASATNADGPSSDPPPPKVLPKFRKPPVRRPPPPQASETVPQQLRNRKRPLQPGELQQQYYGIQDSSLIHGQHHPSPPIMNGPSPESHAQWSGAGRHPNHPPIAVPSSVQALEYPPHRHQPQPQPHRSVSFQAREHPAPLPPLAPSNDPRGAAHPAGLIPHPRQSAEAVAAPITDSSRYRAETGKENGWRNNNLASQAFAGNNGFDPSRFYGNDEEEEEEEEDEADERDYGGRDHESWGAAWGRGGNGATSDVAPNQSPPQNESSSNSGAPAPVVRTNEANSFGGTLSEDQLLDLFGLPPSASASSSSVISPPLPHHPSPHNHLTSGQMPMPHPKPGTSTSRVVDVSDFTLPDDDDSSSSSSD